MKYPPMMMIKKKADGTMSYRGVSIDILNYIGKALDIRFSFSFVYKFFFSKYFSIYSIFKIMKHFQFKK